VSVRDAALRRLVGGRLWDCEGVRTLER
jgi:hypothetical protein